MTKLKLTLFVLVAAVSLATAQEFKIKPGNIQLSTGIGLVPTFAADHTNTLVPPLSARLDVFITPNFALGAYAAYSSVEGETKYQQAEIIEQFQTDMWITGLRATATSNDLNGWRIYGGAMIGYSIPDVEKEVNFLDPEKTRDDESPSFSRPAEDSMIFSGYVGAQRFVTQRMALYAEAGLGISLLNAGLTFQF